MTTLYIIVPCHNDVNQLSKTAATLLKKYEQLAKKGMITSDSKIVFIDNASTDDTWRKIRGYHRINPAFGGIKLSAYTDRDKAILCGLLTLKGYADAIISIGSDLKDDIGAIDKMLEKFELGYDVVYGVRDMPKKEFPDADKYYRGLKACGVGVVRNHVDFRLMSRRAIECLAMFKERNIFLKGIIPQMGFRSAMVKYSVTPDESDETFKDPSSQAMDASYSFSTHSLHMVMLTGLIMTFISIFFMLFFLVTHKSIDENFMKFFFSTVWFIGSLLIVSVGIVGEYIGKLYMEVKGRPRFIVEDLVLDIDKSK